VKLFYPEGDPVDMDDLQGPLGEAIAKAIVPKGCRLGGVVVLQETEAQRDPCVSVCPQRNRDPEAGGCGGRPASPQGIYAALGKAVYASNTSSDARRRLRSEQISYMNRLVEQAPKKLKKKV
jgi:hypothetical protein